VRIDMFLRNAGIIPHRSRAKEACDAGLVRLDGKVVKPASEVQRGQKLRIELSLSVREYEILDLPKVPVAKRRRDEYARLLSERRSEVDDW
jgi:ribosomal 50S subunit-recycling heat shock protein